MGFSPCFASEFQITLCIHDPERLKCSECGTGRRLSLAGMEPDSLLSLQLLATKAKPTREYRVMSSSALLRHFVQKSKSVFNRFSIASLSLLS